MDEAQTKAAWQKHFAHERELREYLSGGAGPKKQAAHDTLILYRADSLDAEAAKELLLERYPAAEVRPMDPHTVPIWFKQRAQHVWCIGLPGDRPADDLYHPIKPTADACMAMLVWRELRRFPCRRCEEFGDDEECPDCDGGGFCFEAPPTWLCYLDDGARGRWELEDSKAVWTAVTSHGASAMAELRLIESRSSPAYSVAVIEGRAILRARERWEAELDEQQAAVLQVMEAEEAVWFCGIDGAIERAISILQPILPGIARAMDAKQSEAMARAEHQYDELRRRCQELARREEQQRKCAGGWEALAREYGDEIDELRAERDEFAQTILRLEGERRELRARIKDAESRCNEVSTAGLRLLREALRIGDCVEARHASDWARLHKIAGVDSLTDPP